MDWWREWPRKIGGAEGSRTPDLYNAIVALSQLSYGPIVRDGRATLGNEAPAREARKLGKSPLCGKEFLGEFLGNFWGSIRGNFQGCPAVAGGAPRERRDVRA